MAVLAAPPARFDLIVFDLDDTLLDTSLFLVPQASRESCEAMVKAGLRATVEACLKERESFMHQNPRGSVYDHLVDHFTATDRGAALTAGHAAFYDRDVHEAAARLVPGAHQLLVSLKGRYRLYLLTAGTLATQKKKVDLLGIRHFFDDVFFVDPAKSETKESFFKKLVQGEDPRRLLSVGNRPDTDLAPAKKWHWQTCWVRYGEYRAMVPTTREERPDYVIETLAELETQCRL